MNVTLLASSEFALPTLQALIDRQHEVSVGTQPARGAGRGQSPQPTPVALGAKALGLAVEEIENVNEKKGLEWLSSTSPDVLVVIAFGQKLGSAARAVAPWGCFNIHPSLLPRWRGAAPVPAAILAGESEMGVCVIDVAEKMDSGEILEMRRASIPETWNAGQALEELASRGAEILLDVLDSAARGSLQRVRQDETKSTHAPKVTSEDGRIRWEESAEQVSRRVRAMTPRPGAYSFLPDGMRLKVIRGQAISTERRGLPGEVLEMEGLVVACDEGAFEVLEAQRSGGKAMMADALLRGHPILPGTRMGP